ncbi:unnamed protein product [Trichobilharzia szidati]|nr:unnamed protein product [Trichobilharzia szidati]
MLRNRLFPQSEHVKRKIWDGVSRAEEKLGGRLPTIDPIKDLNIMDDRIKQQSATIALLKARMEMNTVSTRTGLKYLIDQFNQRATNLMKIERIRKPMQPRILVKAKNKPL